VEARQQVFDVFKNQEETFRREGLEGAEIGSARRQFVKDCAASGKYLNISLENILEDALCFLKVWSAQCLNWSIVTRAHAP
jgi:hypothetical protein